MSEILDDGSYELENPEKKRHGCVTTWLVLMLIVNVLTAFSWITLSVSTLFDSFVEVSNWMFWALSIMSLLNILFTILLFRWKVIGFYGFSASVLIIFTINMAMGLSVLECLSGIAGIIVLYVILQIKGSDDVSAWNNLE